MNSLTYRAYQVAAPNQQAEFVSLTDADLPKGDLLVRVTHSSLNYKDGLAMLGKPGVVRSYPMTCGIDLAGVVVGGGTEAGFSPGDEVVLTGAGLSETRPGGYSGYQRVDSSWAMPVPKALGSWGAMAVGTAGLTAMLCVLRLKGAGVEPKSGAVLVTGATGGVGSFAVSLLSRLGYEVHAATGKESEAKYLENLGAAEIISRNSLSGEPKALGKQKWAGAVDCVGGATLANALSHIGYSGAVAACGLAGGPSLPATVMPFILRNVSLLGVDSVNAPMDLRREAWKTLYEVFGREDLREMVTDAGYEDITELAAKILVGGVRGRVIVNIEGMSD